MSESDRRSLEKVLSSMGDKFKTANLKSVRTLRSRIADDPSDLEALLGLADTNVLLFIFGYLAREETIPEAEAALRAAAELDPDGADVSRMSGILSFLDWDWTGAEQSLLDAIRKNPDDLSARHWYSLFLVAMGRFDEAMSQSDEILRLDPDEDYLIGRGSLFWFQHRFDELKELMHRTIERDPAVPWGYDWLGMAYNGLEQHDDAIRTYKKAFELSDGTAEVGAGYAHALGQAGETALAKQMADFYEQEAERRYVPPVQRAYIHIGIDENDEAIRLIEQAFEERSWFLIFMKVEPWLDPVRGDGRFGAILERMEFPD